MTQAKRSKRPNLPRLAEIPAGEEAKFEIPDTVAETRRLLHELEVHKVELEMQNAELTRARDEAEKALEKYTDLYEFAAVGYFSLDHEGIILSVNLTSRRMLKFERSRLIGRRFNHFVAIASRPTFATFSQKLFAATTSESCEVTLQMPGQAPVYVQLEGITTTSGQDCRIALVDISERKRVEIEQEASAEFLRLADSSKGVTDLVRKAMAFFKEHSGCEAVGIRLRDGEDYPFFGCDGFTKNFILTENTVISRDQSGEVIRDCAGNPVLACMCGKVICQRTDPSKPFFTTLGSFWTNSTTELLASNQVAGGQTLSCNNEGYESVALIPLHLGEERLGLLQLNDRQKGRFTPDAISLWERLATHLAVALAKFRADDALRESEELYRSLFGNMLNGSTYCRMIFQDGKPHDFVYLAVNKAFEALTGLKDVVGKRITEVIPGIRESDPQLLEIYGRVVTTGQPEQFEIFIEALQMWLWISVFSASHEHFVAVLDVITDRKMAEKALHEHQQTIMEMAFEVQLAEERERARIAGELHDRVGQRLLLGKMKLDMLESRIASEATTNEIASISSLVEESIQDIRSLTFQLRPPLLATDGLVAAVAWLCNELKDDYGLDVEFFDDQAAKPLKYELRALLYQAVRELLLNVIKHAGAKLARLTLKSAADTVIITVEDKGCGFDPAEISTKTSKTGGYGLFNLKQKIEYLKGHFSFETAPGKGTRTTIIFPLDHTT